MELQGAIQALELIQDSSDPVPLYTDSRYVLDGISRWIHNWKKNQWRTASKQPVKNHDLWQHLDRLNRPYVQWQWVRGHAGNQGNDACDAIARAAAREFQA